MNKFLVKTYLQGTLEINNVLINFHETENIKGKMKTKKAYSIVEFLLVIMILGILAAVFIPATTVIGEHVRADVVKAHLSQIIEAGKKYNADRDTNSVDYKTLVSERYLKAMQSMAGEKYDGVIIESKGGRAAVETSKGSKIEKVY